MRLQRLVHVAIPISRGINVYWSITFPSDKGLYPFYTGNWVLYSHITQAILTFNGGLKSNTISLYLTDIAHHHLGVGILFVWASHVYSTLYKGFGHRIRDVFFVNGNSGPMILKLGKSVDLQLSLALGGSCGITSVVAQDIYSLTPYLYLSYDYIILVALYVHHSWIASILMMGSFAHAGIFLIRDYQTLAINGFRQDVIFRILAHKGAIISHLSWICLWLGFHTLGLYIHNDTIVAFGEQEKQILIEPVFGQIIQESSGKACACEPCARYCKSFDSFIMPLGPGDSKYTLLFSFSLTIQEKHLMPALDSSFR